MADIIIGVFAFLWFAAVIGLTISLHHETRKLEVENRKKLQNEIKRIEQDINLNKVDDDLKKYFRY